MKKSLSHSTKELFNKNSNIIILTTIVMMASGRVGCFSAQNGLGINLVSQFFSNSFANQHFDLCQLAAKLTVQ